MKSKNRSKTIHQISTLRSFFPSTVNRAQLDERIDINGGWIRHPPEKKFHKNFDTCFFLPEIEQSESVARNLLPD